MSTGSKKHESESEPIVMAERLALRPREAATALGLSERTLRNYLPEIPHIRRGNVVLIPIDGLKEWLRVHASHEAELVESTVRDVLAEFSS